MEIALQKPSCCRLYVASRFVGLLVVLWLAVFTSGAQSRAKSNLECGPSVISAERDLDAGRTYEALSTLKTIIQTQPRCADAYFYLGTIYLGIEQYSVAAQYALRSIDLNPGSGAYHNLSGAVLLAQNSIQPALNEFNLALTDSRIKHPEKVWANIAYSHETLLQWDQAVFALNSAITLRSRDAGLRVALARALLETDRPSLAVQHLTYAARLRPMDAGILTVLATAYARSGQTALEIEAEKKAVTLDPRNKAAHYLLGQTLLRLGQKERGTQELSLYRDLETQELEAQQRSSKLDSLSLMATAKLQEGDLARAEELCHDMIGLDPDFTPALYSLAFVRLKQGDYESAISALKRVVGFNPLNAGAYFYLGDAYRQVGKIPEAFEATQHAIIIFDQNAHYFNQLGELYLEQGRELEAKTAFEQAIKLDETFTLAQLNLGTLLLQMGELNPAIDHLKAAAKLRADNAEIHRRLGLAFCNNEQAEDCISQYKEAVRLSPANDRYRAALTETFVSLRRWTEAEDMLTREIKVYPQSGRAHYNLGELYYVQGRLREALPELDKAAKLASEVSLDRIYVKTAFVYLNQLEFDRAIREFQKALQINPDLVIAHLGLANLYARQERDDDAVKEYHIALALEPARADVQTWLAQLYFRQSKYDLAISACQTALSLDPRERRAEYILGQSLIREGHTAEGVTALTKFKNMEEEAETIEHQAREALSLNQEAVSAFRNNDFDGAISLLRKAVERQPEKGMGYLRLGFVLMKAGHHREAIANLLRALAFHFDVPQIHHYLSQEYSNIGRVEESRKEHDIYAAMQKQRLKENDDEQ